MLLLKGCPRCRGDLLLIRYCDEHTLSCLQCGYARALPPARTPLAAPRPRPTPAPPGGARDSA